MISDILKDDLSVLAETTKNKEQLLQAINIGCLQSLQKFRLINRSMQVSAQTIKGKKREYFWIISTHAHLRLRVVSGLGPCETTPHGSARLTSGEPRRRTLP